MHFLENSMFVLNAYFCRELRFVASLGSKLRFFTQKYRSRLRFFSEFLRKELAGGGSVAESGVDWSTCKTKSKLKNVRGKAALQKTENQKLKDKL